MGIKRFLSRRNSDSFSSKSTSNKRAASAYIYGKSGDHIMPLPRFHMGFDRWDDASKCRNHRFDIQLSLSNRNKSNRRVEWACRRCQARGEFLTFDSGEWHELLMALWREKNFIFSLMLSSRDYFKLTQNFSQTYV